MIVLGARSSAVRWSCDKSPSEDEGLADYILTQKTEQVDIQGPCTLNIN